MTNRILPLMLPCSWTIRLSDADFQSYWHRVGWPHGSYGVYAVTGANRFGATQTSFDLEAPERLVLTLERRLLNEMQLHVRGSDNLEFSIELSADLRTWQPATGGQLVDGQAVLPILESALGDHVFFRGRYVPIGLDDD